MISNRLMLLVTGVAVATNLGPFASGQLFNVPEVLYLRFNEGSGTTSLDEAVPGVGSLPVIGTPTLWTTTMPLLGSASLQTSPAPTGIAICQSHGAFSISGAWTIEVLFRRNGSGLSSKAHKVIVAGSNLAANGGSFSLVSLRSAPHNLRFDLSAPSGPPYSMLIANGAPNGIITHLAIVHDPVSATLKAFKNGTAVNSIAAPSPPILAADATGVLIGGFQIFMFGSGFAGTIDEVRIWSRARTAAELTAYANQELVGLTEGVAALEFTPPLPAFDFDVPVGGSFSISGTVGGLRLPDGSVTSAPTFDPILQGPLTISGNFSGNDLTNLSDIILSPTLVNAAAIPGSDELTLTASLSRAAGAGDDWRFENDVTALPVRLRALGNASPVVVQRIGSGSPILDLIASQMNGGATMSLLVTSTPQGPRVRSIAFDYVLAPLHPESRLRTPGAGSVEVGVIDLPGARIYNLFALNPQSPLGQGSFFGLEVGPFQYDQAALPFPSPPFSGLATPSGIFYFSLPGIAPPGLVVDMVTFALSPSGTTIDFILPVQRVVF